MNYKREVVKINIFPKMSIRFSEKSIKSFSRKKKLLRNRFLSYLIIFYFLFFLLIISGLLFFKNDWSWKLKTQLFHSEYSLVSDSLMSSMKDKGCVFDGLLTPRFGGNFEERVALLSRSECVYLHRAVETWNTPPDFKIIQEWKNTIEQKTGKDFIYGFFIAESLDLTKGYYYPDEKRYFNFSAMCRPGSFGFWGDNTCKPSIEKPEYRKYLSYITKKAIDLGFRDFTFGQIYHQDPNWEKSDKAVRSIIKEIKNYGQSKGVEIAVGAQTNTIDDEEYLRNFDYITGGVGQDKTGWIEDEGPCWSVLEERANFCWAMMWNEKFKEKANNVFVYLDWNNSYDDDIHRFVSMTQEQRAFFLGKAYDFFRFRGLSFLMPMGEVLGHIGGKCVGPSSEFYSSSNAYGCKDEDAINSILRREAIYLPNYSRLISQNVPSIVSAGKKYEVEIEMQNEGYADWTKEGGFELGIWNPQDSFVWKVDRVYLDDNEQIKNKESKKFRFEIIAPNEPGVYSFQWRMKQEKRDWFGQVTKEMMIEVME